MPIGLNEGNIGRSICPGFRKSTYGASLERQTLLKSRLRFWKRSSLNIFKLERDSFFVNKIIRFNGAYKMRGKGVP